MIEALYEGAPGWIGPAAAAPFAAESSAAFRIWKSVMPASRAGRPPRRLGSILRQRRRARILRHTERELDPEGRAALLGLLQRALDLLHQLRDDGEPERAPLFRLARLQSDAVVGDRQDPPIALALRRNRDGAAAPEREGMFEGVGQHLDGDEGERHRSVERHAHRLRVHDRFNAAVPRSEGVRDLLHEPLEIFADLDRGEVGRVVEEGVDPGHRADAPDRALEGFALLRGEIARAEAQQAL